MIFINKKEDPEAILSNIKRKTEERDGSGGGLKEESLKLEGFDVVLPAGGGVVRVTVEEEDDERRGGDAEEQESKGGHRK